MADGEIRLLNQVSPNKNDNLVPFFSPPLIITEFYGRRVKKSLTTALKMVDQFQTRSKLRGRGKFGHRPVSLVQVYQNLSCLMELLVGFYCGIITSFCFSLLPQQTPTPFIFLTKKKKIQREIVTNYIQSHTQAY